MRQIILACLVLALAAGTAEARKHKSPAPQSTAAPVGQASHPGGGSSSK